MEYVAVAVLVVLAGLLFLARYYFDAQGRSQRAASASAIGKATSTLSKADRSRAVSRAQGLGMRPKKERVRLWVIGDERTPAAAETYRAAYELVIRGIDVQLDMADVVQDIGPGRSTFDVMAPHVASRMTYTTEGFAAHLGSIESMADFRRYAPFRADREMWLLAHPDDLGEAYALLRELGVRLSALHHADQMWWEPDR